MKSLFVIPVSAALAQAAWADGTKPTVKVCTNEVAWYPYFMPPTADKPVRGMLVELTTNALERSGFVVQFEAMPWARCLNAAKDGKVDLVVPGSYSAERAEFLIYPDQADKKNLCNNPLELQCVSFVAVTSAKQNFSYNGDVKTLPEPIRVPRGTSVKPSLIKAGVEESKISEAKGDLQTLRQLLRDNNGCVITSPDAAEEWTDVEEFKGKFVVHADKPTETKSYFLPVSKKSNLTAADREKIWKNMVELTKSKAYMRKLREKYEAEPMPVGN